MVTENFRRRWWTKGAGRVCIWARWLVLAAACIELSACGRSDHSTYVVRTLATPTGMLQGREVAGLLIFKGVPYAAPPLGPLRWRPPQPLRPWAGVRVAEQYGNDCEQRFDPLAYGLSKQPKSEDCLALNIWAPASHKTKLPIMVWIHGGGFVNGSGSAPGYDGSALARRGVILVTFNYRLGRFGFFAHPALDAENSGEPKGNYGLMDMIAVLRWVQVNGAALGGDPGQVTVFGESAGGVAVNDLMISPAASSLFARAIVQSGGGREIALPLHGEGSARSAERVGEAFASRVGLAHATAAGLRALTAAQILDAGDPDMVKGGEGSTIADGQILPMSPSEGFARSLEAHIPYIVGSNSLELPVPQDKLAGVLDRLPDVTPAQLSVVAKAYPSQASFDDRAATDILFTEPAARMAAFHAKNGQPTWLYRFSVLPLLGRFFLSGAFHTSEIPYVFHTLGTYPKVPTLWNDAEQSDSIGGYWVQFAKTGDPNGGNATYWPRYDADADILLSFTNAGPASGPVPHRKLLESIAQSYSRNARPANTRP